METGSLNPNSFKQGQAPWEVNPELDKAKNPLTTGGTFKVGEAPWEKPSTVNLQQVPAENLDELSAEKYNPTFPAETGGGVTQELMQTPKTLGNLPSSSWNFLKGVVSMFNPVEIIKNVGADITGFQEASKYLGPKEATLELLKEIGRAHV